MGVSNSCFSNSESDNQVSEAHFNRAHTENMNYGADCIRIKRNDTMSETKLFKEHNTQKISTRKTINGESVVVISNLDSNHDITSVVDHLLQKEFSDASSIFVVVPDDNNSDLSSECSTICIQLSQVYPNWNQKQSYIEEPEILPRRNSSTTSVLKISAKDKKYCMEETQETVASFHENKIINHHTLTNSSSHEKRKQKLCQISTPNQHRTLSVSTDTTSDRPCCCALKTCGNHNLLPEHPCVANVVSDLITRFPVNQGQNCDGYHRLPKMYVTQQASFESINRVPMTIGPCAVPSCLGHPGCHNLSGCGAAADKPPTYQATISDMHFELVNSDSDDDKDVRNCSDHKDIKGCQIKCTCGKSRTISRAFCSYEQHQPGVSETTTGPQAGTGTSGCQCSSDKCRMKSGTISFSISLPLFIVDSSLGALDPAGRVSQMEPREMYFKAGHLLAPTSTDPKMPCKDCACVKSKEYNL